MKPFDKELVTGSILRSVWKLSWPAVAMYLINGSAGFIDHVLVGQFVESPDNAANAAMGVAWQLFLVVIVFIASLFNGMGVLVAQYAGRENREMLSRVVYHTFLVSLYAQLFLVAPVGYFLSPYLLEFFTNDPNVQFYALPYMQVLFTCSAALFLNFMLNGAMQSSGDAKTPLILSAMNSVLNLTLTAGLITGFGPFPMLGALGAAVGTVIAPIPGVLFALYLIASGRMIITVPSKLTFFPDWHIIWDVARIGIPTGIQAVLLNLGGAFLLYYVDKLPHGAAAQAAYVICYSQWFALITWASFGIRMASSTLIGQNISAGDTARGKRAVNVAAGLGLVWAGIFGLVFFFAPHYLMALFNADEGPVLPYGVWLLRVLAFSGIFLITTLAYTGGLQGAGDTKKPMWIALITQIGVLLGICEISTRIMAWLQPMSLPLFASRLIAGAAATWTDAAGLLGLELVYTVFLGSGLAIWLAILASHGLRLVMSYYFFAIGDWTSIVREDTQEELAERLADELAEDAAEEQPGSA